MQNTIMNNIYKSIVRKRFAKINIDLHRSSKSRWKISKHISNILASGNCLKFCFIVLWILCGCLCWCIRIVWYDRTRAAAHWCWFQFSAWVEYRTVLDVLRSDMHKISFITVWASKLSTPNKLCISSKWEVRILC